MTHQVFIHPYHCSSARQVLRWNGTQHGHDTAQSRGRATAVAFFFFVHFVAIAWIMQRSWLSCLRESLLWRARSFLWELYCKRDRTTFRVECRCTRRPKDYGTTAAWVRSLLNITLDGETKVTAKKRERDAKKRKTSWILTTL